MRLHQSSAAHVVVLTASLNPFAKQAVGIGDGALAGACTSISDLARRGLDAARADREPVPRQANTVLKKGSRMACSTPAQPESDEGKKPAWSTNQIHVPGEACSGGAVTDQRKTPVQSKIPVDQTSKHIGSPRVIVYDLAPFCHPLDNQITWGS